MNTKMIAIKISLLLLAGLLSGNAAWAEGKAKSQTEHTGAECKIIPGTKLMRQGDVLDFGALKLRVLRITDSELGTRAYEAGVHVYASGDAKILGAEVGKHIGWAINDKTAAGMDEVNKICGQTVNFGLSANHELTVSVW